MQIICDRLLLRTVTELDIKEVARMWEFEKGTISEEAASEAILSMQRNHQKNMVGSLYHICFAIFEKESDTIIGWCGLDGRHEGKLDIFYLVDAAYRGRGYATECARALLSYAFIQMQVPYVHGGCDKNNPASYRVMEKIGMQRIGSEENGDPLFGLDRATYTSTMNKASWMNRCCR